MFRYRLRTLLILFALAPPLVAYVSSYYVVSRRGYADVDRYGLKGFYFVLPGTVPDWKERNQRFNRFYYPLIQLELFLGTGHHIGAEPLEGLS